MLSTSFNSKFYHQAYRDSKRWHFLSLKCCGLIISLALLSSRLAAPPRSSGPALPTHGPHPCSHSCEVCGQQAWGSSLGTNLTSAETFSWQDTLILIGVGQVSAGRTIKAQPLRGIDSLTQPKESFSEGSDHRLDSCGCTHLAPLSPLVPRRNMTQRHPQPAFLSQPSPTTAGFGSFPWKMSAKALEPPQWFTENSTSTWAFQLQPTPRVKGRKRENHKWIVRWETDVGRIHWQGILQLDPLSSWD